MTLSLRFTGQYLQAFARNWRKFLIWGIVLLILGILALSATAFTTLVSVVFLGFLIFVGGIVVAFDTFSFWWGKWGGFLLHVIIAILYLYVGFTLITHPVSGSVSLTLLLGILFTIAGLCRIGFYALSKIPNWGWGLFNGVITLILGLLILSNWPASSLFIIGLLVGIDLIFSGWSYIMAALAARAVSSNPK